MPLNINTSRLNDALRQMASFFMQNKLGEMSQQRQMDTYSEQDRLMRERSAAEEVAAQRGRKSQYDLDISKAFKTGGIKAIGDPVLDGWRQRAELAKEQGDMVNYELFSNKYAAGFTGFVRAAHKMQTGEDIPENEIQTLIENSDIPTMMSAVKERNVTERDLAQRPIQERQTKVAESNAFTSAGNLALAKTKEARSLSGELTPEEYGKFISTKVQKTMDNINSLMGILRGVSGAGNAYNVEEVIKSIEGSGANRLLGGAVSPQALGKMYEELSRYETMAMEGKRLTPTQMRRLDSSVNVFGDYSIPRENEMASQLEKDTNAAIEAEGGVNSPAVASSVASTQETIPAEVQAYMLKHPELSLDFVMKKYREYMRLKGVE